MVKYAGMTFGHDGSRKQGELVECWECEKCGMRTRDREFCEWEERQHPHPIPEEGENPFDWNHFNNQRCKEVEIENG